MYGRNDILFAGPGQFWSLPAESRPHRSLAAFFIRRTYTEAAGLAANAGLIAGQRPEWREWAWGNGRQKMALSAV